MVVLVLLLVVGAIAARIGYAVGYHSGQRDATVRRRMATFVPTGTSAKEVLCECAACAWWDVKPEEPSKLPRRPAMTDEEWRAYMGQLASAVRARVDVRGPAASIPLEAVRCIASNGRICVLRAGHGGPRMYASGPPGTGG